MAFSDHFSSLAPQYAAYRPGYPDALFAWLADVAPGRALAWDCACGNGQASQGLAGYFKHVIATDASEAQLKAAKPHPKIEYRTALAESSNLPEHSVDLITCAQAAHWFKHDLFYKEVRRVLKPRGVIALWTYERFSIDDAAVRNAIKVFYEQTISSYWPPERAYVKDHYRTLPFPFENELVPPAFHEVLSWDLHRLLGYFRSWSAVKQFKQAKGFDPVDNLEKELIPLWGDPASAKTITMPLYLRVARI